MARRGKVTFWAQAYCLDCDYEGGEYSLDASAGDADARARVRRVARKDANEGSHKRFNPRHRIRVRGGTK